jgi:acetyltransferase-like isoleucine patch superfamily enzyme
MSLIRSSTEPWGIYVGSPAKRIKNRSKDLLELEKQYINEIGRD